MTAIVLPIAIPLVAGMLCLFFQRRPRVQGLIVGAGAVALLVAAIALARRVLAEGPIMAHVGGWPEPFAISFLADGLSALMVLVTAIIGLAGALYSLADIDRGKIAVGYFPLYCFLIMAVCGAFLTGDMFNLFVWFEVMLIASFALMAMGGERLQMTGAIKYVAINLISSALFLVAVGVLYAVCHSLSMADLPARLAAVASSHPYLVLTMAALFAVSFAIKAGLFPVFSWLPASYHTAPAAAAAVFAGLLTKVGVYAFLRIFGNVFPVIDPLFTAILCVAGATMIAGALGAVAQSDMRRILGFHIISQIGYIMLAVGLVGVTGPELRGFAIAAAVFYTIHHILVKSNLFFIAGIIERMGGTGELSRMGGLARRAPWLAVLFAIPALSLAGIPPLSGFWAKLVALKAVLAAEHYVLAGLAACAGLLTLISMMKIWNGAFWKPAPEGYQPDGRVPVLMIVAVVALAALTVAIGLVPGLLFQWSERAADMMLGAAVIEAPALVLNP